MRRIYRRACVLRATGRADEAVALEHTELSRALATARLATEDTTLEHSVLGEEAERIAQAQTLAELVAPLLAQQLRTELPGLNRPASMNTVSSETAVTPAAAPAGRPAGDVPPIADLIESMLSQQSARGPRRS